MTNKFQLDNKGRVLIFNEINKSFELIDSRFFEDIISNISTDLKLLFHGEKDFKNYYITLEKNKKSVNLHYFLTDFNSLEEFKKRTNLFISIIKTWYEERSIPEITEEKEITFDI